MTADNLKQLLASVREEAVKTARQEAETVLSKARSDADRILSEAQLEAARILAAATRDAKFQLNATSDATHRAIRDAKLKLTNDLQSILKRLILTRVQESLDVEFLQRLLTTIAVSVVGTSDHHALEISLASNDLKQLKDGCLKAIQDDIEQGTLFKETSGLHSGFQIRRQGDDVYLDFSDQAITDFLCAQLNTTFTDLVRDVKTGDDNSP